MLESSPRKCRIPFAPIFEFGGGGGIETASIQYFQIRKTPLSHRLKGYAI